MTHGRRSWIVVAILSLISMGSFAQSAAFKDEEKPKFPRWVSDKGYWVVESNIKAPKDHIIRFYNTGNVLVYKETLVDVKLNPEKVKTKMKLKKILESSVMAWENKKQSSEELALVKSVL
ncbi:MAG: hypothetical protein ABI675_13385 [Chitinophagaceae bacterium]